MINECHCVGGIGAIPRENALCQQGQYDGEREANVWQEQVGLIIENGAQCHGIGQQAGQDVGAQLEGMMRSQFIGDERDG